MNPHPIDTEALRRLADAATDGPWEAHGTTIAAITGSGSCQGCSGLVSPAHEPSCYWSEIAAAGEADAEFIAAARTAVPALLDALAAAEHRATRAETQSEARRIDIAYWTARAQMMGRKRDAGLRDLAHVQKERDNALARIKAVEALCDRASRDAGVLERNLLGGHRLYPKEIRRALDGSVTPPGA